MAFYWNIEEEESYRTSLEMICDDVLALAPAIEIVDYGLRRNPRGFAVIPGHVDTYVAKTAVIVTVDHVVPAIRIFFTVNETEQEIRKWWVDLVPVDEIDVD
jgi:hypothetical protein